MYSGVRDEDFFTEIFLGYQSDKEEAADCSQNKAHAYSESVYP